MAKKKEQRSNLELWAVEFPDLMAWKNCFLIKQTGPLLSGICLDRTSNPALYIPRFFYHNLLAPWPSPEPSLGYSVPLLYRRCQEPLKYGAPISDTAIQFKYQIKSLRDNITFDIFIQHVTDNKKNGIHDYLPHTLQDIITITSHLGDADWCRSKLDSACACIAAARNINFHIIGSVGKWRAGVESILDASGDELVKQNRNKFKLPPLPYQPMAYSRPSNILDIFSFLSER